MNIISNNCTGAFIYKALHIQYNNPFMWSSMSTEDFMYLVKNYNNICLNKFEATMLDGKFNYIHIDKKISVFYPHYIQDDNYVEPYYDGVCDVFIKDNIGYTVNKYLIRLNRMNENKENPLFLYIQQKGDDIKLLNEMLNLGCIVVSNENIEHKNHIYYEHSLEHEYITKLPIFLIRNYSNIINPNHLNLIANNCVNSQLYKIFNMPFGNPFTWCRVGIDDFIYLVENYDKIDFNNFDYEFINGAFNGIRIDNKIAVLYIHYIQSDEDKTPRISGPDIYYCNSIDYTVDKYSKRAQRLTNDPIFIYNEQELDDVKKLRKLLDLGCIVISTHKFRHKNNIYLKNACTADTKEVAELLIKKNIIKKVE